MNVFISRTSSSSFWNIALALSSSSPRARALFSRLRRLRSAALDAAARFAEDEAGREEEDVDDASDDASSTVASSASSASSASASLLRVRRGDASSPRASSPARCSRIAAFPFSGPAFSTYMYCADARARDTALSTARCAGVSSRYRSPRTRRDASRPVSVGTDTKTSSRALPLTLTRNAFGVCKPSFPPPFASSASARASRSTQSRSETRTRRGGLPMRTGARSLYALGATPRAAPKGGDGPPLGAPSGSPSAATPAASDGVAVRSPRFSVVDASGRLAGSYASPNVASVTESVRSRSIVDADVSAMIGPPIEPPSDTRPRPASSDSARSSWPLGRCSAPRNPSRCASRSLGTASSLVRYVSCTTSPLSTRSHRRNLALKILSRSSTRASRRTKSPPGDHATETAPIALAAFSTNARTFVDERFGVLIAATSSSV